MKTNIFKLTFMAFAATALITGCSQNEGLDTPDQNNVLAVSTTIQDFTQESKSRVIDEPTAGGYETKFETGDQIGVYAFAEDGAIMCKNMPMTYSAAEKWESTAPLYFYKNATYIAYSPYTAELTGQSVTNIASIKDYFTSKVFIDATKTYSECDLMTAEATTGSELPAANASAITFNFTHAMSMVEFVVPVANYKTTAGYEYSGPIFGLKLKKKEGANAAADIANINALGKGVYRTLLAPVASDITDKDLTFSGELFVGDGTQPVYFETTTPFKPTSGTYKKVKVTYTGAPDPTNVETRDIEVGDYYYSDGGIVHQDALVKPLKNLVGLVFSTTTSTEDQARGWNKGYVLALKGVNTKWGGSSLIFDTYANINTDDVLCAEYCSNLNGYDQTVALANAATVDVVTALNNYRIGDNAVNTQSSSGWYIPNGGQCLALLTELGEQANAYDPANPSGMFSENNNIRKAAKATINSKLAAAGGTQLGSPEFMLLTTEQNATNVWTMQWKDNAVRFFNRPKGTSYELRPVLAF